MRCGTRVLLSGDVGMVATEAGEEDVASMIEKLRSENEQLAARLAAVKGKTAAQVTHRIGNYLSGLAQPGMDSVHVADKV